MFVFTEVRMVPYRVILIHHDVASHCMQLLSLAALFSYSVLQQGGTMKVYLQHAHYCYLENMHNECQFASHSR